MILTSEEDSTEQAREGEEKKKNLTCDGNIPHHDRKKGKMMKID